MCGQRLHELGARELPFSALLSLPWRPDTVVLLWGYGLVEELTARKHSSDLGWLWLVRLLGESVRWEKS